jgi:hypothetical protein
MNKPLSGWIFPGLFLMAWGLSLSGSIPPGMREGSAFEERAISWLLYFAGFAFLSASVMHSVFAKKTAASIGWVTNGFQYEIAFVSLGLGCGCFYAIFHGLEARIAISLPIISFLFLAGVNHAKEMVLNKNYAPNNTLILIWDFGVSISLFALIFKQFI